MWYKFEVPQYMDRINVEFKSKQARGMGFDF